MKVIAIVVSITLVMLGFPLPAGAVPQLPKSEPQTAAVVPPEPAATVPETLKELEQNLTKLQALLTDGSNLRQRQAKIEPVLLSVSDLKTQLDDLDVKAQSEFSDIEAQIRDQNLPDNILQRHFDTVARYHQNQQVLLDALDAVENAADTGRLRRETDQALAQVQALAPSKHTPFDPSRLPVRFPTGNVRAPLETQAQWQQFLGQPADLVRKTTRTKIAPPTAADLAETPDIQLSLELKNLAETLGYNPISIYRWVYDNIEFIPTYGSIQGAHLTYLNRQGNAADISSLLISLLRISGIHSRYVVGVVEIRADKMVNWLGVSDANAAKNLLSQGRIPTTVVVSGGVIKYFKVEHIWTEAWIDFAPSRGARHRKGDSWVPMDASFKQYEYHKGLDLSEAVPVSSSLAESLAAQIDPNELGVTGLDADLINAAVEEYGEQLAAYTYQHHPDLTLADTLDSKSIIPSKRRYLSMSLPFRVVTKGGRFAELPNHLRHSVTLKFYNSVSARQLDNPALSYTISLSALSDMRLGITYEPGSESDAQALENFRESDQETLPVYLFNLKPVIKLEDTAMAQGKAIGMGQPQYLTLVLKDPHQSHQANTTVTVGDELVVGVNAGGTTLSQVQRRMDTVDPYTAAENLHLTALHFWAEHDFFDEISAQYYGVRRERMPSVGLFSSPLSVSYFFGIARGGVYRGRQVDVKFNHQVVVSASSSASADTRVQFMQDIGIHGSYLESSVLEQLFDYEEGRGLSTTQILADANAQNIPIYTITADNIDQIWPRLRVSAEVKTDIQNAIGIGHVVIIPEREIQREGWTGSGYIIRDSLTGAGAYLVEGGSNGGIINSLLCEFSKYPQIDYRLIMMVVTGILLESFMPSFMPVVSTNLAQLGVKLAAKGVALALRSSAKAVARSLLKKSIKRNGGLPKRGTSKKPRKDKKQCPCTIKLGGKKRQGERLLKKAGSKPKEDECVDLQLHSVRFLDDLTIHKDLKGRIDPITGAEWENSSLKQFKNEPVGYAGGTQMRVEVKFKPIRPPKEKAVTGVIKGVTTVKDSKGNPIELVMPKGTKITIPKKFTAFLPSIILKAKTKVAGPVQKPFLFEKKTQFYNQMEIDWKFAPTTTPTDADFKRVDSSEHQVYVTLDKPSENLDKLYLTLLHWATSEDKAATKKEAIKNTWSHFANPTGIDDIKTWDNRALRYYGEGIDKCNNIVEDFLKAPNKSSGGCGVFANLFIEALWVNDIASNCVTINPASPENPEGMLIREWEPIRTSFPGVGRYKWQFLLHEEAATMIPPFREDLVYGDLKSVPGLSGQNSVNPSEKAFLDHFIVKVDIPYLPYYDPSYGMTYSGNPNTAKQVFEAEAIYGYFAIHPGDNDELDHYRVRKHQGRGDVLFQENKGSNPLCGAN